MTGIIKFVGFVFVVLPGPWIDWKKNREKVLKTLYKDNKRTTWKQQESSMAKVDFREVYEFPVNRLLIMYEGQSTHSGDNVSC